MRIVGVISSMQSGGAERVMSLLTAHWAQAGHEVKLLTYEPREAVPFYPLDSRVTYHPLALARPSRGFFEAIRLSWLRAGTLRRALRMARPDVVVSFCAQMNVMTLAATRGLGVPVVVSERAEPAAHAIGRVWRLGRRLLYPRARAIVVQTNSARDFFPAHIRRLCWVIPNPVPSVSVLPVPCQPRILAVGRLNAQKGFDLLLTAFARLHRAHPEWALRIVGEGEERPSLMAQARDLGVDRALEMPGLVHDMPAEYAAASVFVLSSRYEGFPNALCEAMALGLPVAASACAGGVTEIVQDGVNGLLAAPGDAEMLARRISELIAEPEKRRKLGAAAREVAWRYSPEKIFAQWESCIASVKAN